MRCSRAGRISSRCHGKTHTVSLLACTCTSRVRVFVLACHSGSIRLPRSPPGGASVGRRLPPPRRTNSSAMAKPRPLPGCVSSSRRPRCNASSRRGTALHWDARFVIVDVQPQPRRTRVHPQRDAHPSARAQRNALSSRLPSSSCSTSASTATEAGAESPTRAVSRRGVARAAPSKTSRWNAQLLTLGLVSQVVIQRGDRLVNL